MEYVFKTTAEQDAGIALLVAKHNAAQDGSAASQLTAGEYLIARVSAAVDAWIKEAKQ